MTKTIQIPFSDEQAQQIIQTWLDGPCGRVWCRRAVQSEYQSTRWHLTLNAEGSDAYMEGDPEVSFDLIPQSIRSAIEGLLEDGQPAEHRKTAAAALSRGAIHVDAGRADTIVQMSVFGRVVFG
jgi:hypothetical protein